MRPKLTSEEIAALKQSLEMEDLPDDDDMVRAYIEEKEEELFNAHDPIEDANPGDVLWMTWPTGNIVKCTVIKEVEDTPPKYYEVAPEGNDSNVTMPAARLYKSRRACFIGNVCNKLLETIWFTNQLMSSFTGEEPKKLNEDHNPDRPAAFAIGDRVWYINEDMGAEPRYLSGIVTDIRKETDCFDAPFMPYIYTVTTRKGHKRHPIVRHLSDDEIFKTRNQAIMAEIAWGNVATIQGAPLSYASLRGTTETEEDVPDDYEATSI